MLAGGVAEVVGAEDVVGHALVHVELQLVDVLVGGGVEHDVRLVLAEDPAEQGLVADVS